MGIKKSRYNFIFKKELNALCRIICLVVKAQP